MHQIFQPRTKIKSKTEVILKQLPVTQALEDDVFKSYYVSLPRGYHIGVQKSNVALKSIYGQKCINTM